MNLLEDQALSCLSTLAYFAAHAPHEVPAWFKPVMPEPRPVIPEFAVADLPIDVVNAINDAFSQTKMNLHSHEARLLGTKARLWWYPRAEPDVRSWIETRLDRAVAASAWDIEYERQRMLQWPWTFARLVLKAESETKP